MILNACLFHASKIPLSPTYNLFSLSWLTHCKQEQLFLPSNVYTNRAAEQWENFIYLHTAIDYLLYGKVHAAKALLLLCRMKNERIKTWWFSWFHSAGEALHSLLLQLQKENRKKGGERRSEKHNICMQHLRLLIIPKSVERRGGRERGSFKYHMNRIIISGMLEQNKLQRSAVWIFSLFGLNCVQISRWRVISVTEVSLNYFSFRAATQSMPARWRVMSRLECCVYNLHETLMYVALRVQTTACKIFIENVLQVCTALRSNGSIQSLVCFNEI